MEGPVKNKEHDEEVDSSEELIYVVTNFQGEYIRFQARLDMPISNLFRNFYEELNLTEGTVRFCFQGKFVNEKDTPRELGIVSGDIVDGFEEQLGG